MIAKITKRLIDQLVGKQKPASDYYIFDTDLVGFGLRIRASGSMSFIAQYKFGKGRGAPTRRVTLGPDGQIDTRPGQARRTGGSRGGWHGW